MYTDIHSHILPGVDDGAQNLEEALSLISSAYKHGTQQFVATPHFYASYHSLGEQLSLAKERLGLLCQEIIKKQIPVKIILGFEVRFFHGISSCEELNHLTINGSKTLLLELGPQPITDSIIEELVELYYQGYDVILAHIERYSKISGFSKLKPLIKNRVVKCQVNAASFVEGPFVKLSYKLVKKGWCDYIAGDMHSVLHRPSKLKAAMLLIEEKIGKATANKLIKNSNKLFESVLKTT
ncbi:MAG: hypothetical protein IJE01_01205 [Clostridia bacterium]|nr:hypothetical protein [Clostridia bacterium]